MGIQGGATGARRRHKWAYKEVPNVKVGVQGGAMSTSRHFEEAPQVHVAVQGGAKCKSDCFKEVPQAKVGIQGRAAGASRRFEEAAQVGVQGDAKCESGHTRRHCRRKWVYKEAPWAQMGVLRRRRG